MAEEVDFGTDLSSDDDVDETREISGRELVAQDIKWRLQTPRSSGILEADAPAYGIDLLDLLGSVETDNDLASLPERITGEIEDDERISPGTTTVKVTRTIQGPAAAFDIKIHCETADGPFDLVGSVLNGEIKLSVELLQGGIA